ncbi:arylsulfatase A-like enzyme [Actinocorallia herbida]|uniref:Arylsulfatase A-like enzyme n=1 Tax=Actinocorallia herbida TaxID=58109 RepID=A0A3N1CZ07_9ACTN|nr:sulfatase [Actinocorallia herbida]ROO86524.1 arylsulfatase A-like enzyme [Actinocorallia herbida]
MGAEGSLARRGFLAGAAAAIAAAGTAGAAAGAPPVRRAGARPNILVIVTDDQPKQLAWALRKTRKWLGGSGVEFTRGHATTPLCAPSRASIFSGRYAHNHGVRDNFHKLNLDQSTTFQRHLADAGYRNGMFGKYLNEWRIAMPPEHFEDYALLSPVGYVNGRFNRNGKIAELPGYTTHRIRDFARAFIRKGATDPRPWFAYVAPYGAHAPFTPEEKYEDLKVPGWAGRPSVTEKDKSDKPPYLREAHASLSRGRTIRRGQLRTLRSVDDAVGALHDELKATGQLDNTLVIFIGDNGYLWADHGWTRKSVPYRPAYEVPFLLSWPAGGLASGTKDGRLVANIDISATVLDAAGIEPTTPQDGHSLLGRASRDHLLIEFWRQGGDDRPPNSWAAHVSRTGQYTEYYALRTDAAGDEVGTGKVLFREYYDLKRDPYQLVNKLHRATRAQERAWGIPALAARLKADRAA